MKFLGFSFVLLFASHAFAADILSKPDYLITAPRVFRVGTTEKLSVNLFNAFEPWEVTVLLHSKLYGTRLAHASGIFQNDTSGILQVTIPSNARVGGRQQNAKLHIVIKPLNASLPVIKESDIITVKKLSLSVFIQTDKPIYKPGQTIRMRVVGIDGKLRPLSGKINRVSVMDPNSVRMMQWDNVDFRDGMASLKMALSSQPVLGEWKIEATVKGQKTRQLIKVDKYVLPKFQVTIRPPSYVAFDSKEVTATICAQYTYGQPVVGTLKAHFTVKQTYYWYYYERYSGDKKITIQKEIKGCTDFKWTNSELNLNAFKDRYWSTVYFNIEASVTENATKVTQNATKTSTRIQRYRVQLDLSSGTPTIFKPGMPFHGQLKVTEPDGTPLAGEVVTITALNNRFQKTFKVPINGLVNYVIDTIGTRDRSLRIRARQGNASAPRPNIRECYYCYFWYNYYSSSSVRCSAWHSPSNSYLTIKKIPKAVQVGSKARVELVYTTSGKKDKDMKVHYHVMSRGNMVMSGSKILKSGQENTAAEEITGKPSRVKSTLSLAQDFIKVPISQAMVPSCRLLVYYVRDDKETVADSMIIDVEDVLKNQVSISFDGDEKRPGEKTRLTVQAAPGSRVAIAAVDKSVHLLRAGNELTSGHIFDVLKDQDVGPGPTYNSRLCNYDPQWRRGRRSSLVSHDGSRTVDASKAFNDAGVLFYSNLKIETRPCPNQRFNFWMPLRRSGYRVAGLGVRRFGGPKRLLSSSNRKTLPPAKKAKKVKKVKKVKKPPSVRSEFPETWLWTEEVVRNGGGGGRFDGPEGPAMGETPLSGVSPPPAKKVKKPPSVRSEFPETWLWTEEVVRYSYKIKELAEDGRVNGKCWISRNGGGGGGGFERPSESEPAVALMLTNRERPPPAKKVKKVKKPPSVRSEFPETWLWTEEVVSEKTGMAVISAKVPDTITKWYASAFAMSTASGIGVSSPASLTAFQPFFVSFTLPYSVIRGEEVTIITTVFNYKSDCYTIRVDLTDSEDIDLVTQATHKLCVCGNEAKSAKFTIVPRRLGKVPLLVTAKDVQQNVCGGKQGKSLGVADAVSRKLLVEPEGVQQRYTYSSMACLKEDDQDDRFNDVIDVDLPENVVDGSTRAVVSVIGDLMGPTLSVERFLRLPYGCGEQNMVNFAPNIYIMQYLTSVGQLTPEIKNKAQDFMMTGYQRELTYKRPDGSYSAFGSSDEEGNMWLTAFVLRSFAQAKPFIFIDDKEISDTVNWLRRQQLTNGCFPSRGRLFNKAMKGGVSGDGTRTAFVAVALLEAGVTPQDRMITKALSCMMAEASNLTDSYSTALFTYALTLAHDKRSVDFMNKLKAKAVIEAGLTHWENEKVQSKPDSRRWIPPYYRAPSADIEMTAYALMSYVAMSSVDSSLISEALPIIRWLSKQRNSLGGFGSTQDTCVGLQALAMYASEVYTNSTNLQISVGRPSQQRFNPVFTIDNTNRLVLQRAEIPNDLLPIKAMPVSATGSGCALVQADVSYNVLDVDEEPAFNLTVDVKPVPTEVAPLGTVEQGDQEEKQCGPLELKICARWLRDDTSNMAVVDVKLVSGFVADSESLEKLKEKPKLGLKRFELEGSNVILYFDEIKNLCFSFEIHQETVVKKTKPASVHVYDYYETDLSATTTYSIAEDLCSSTQEPGPDPISTASCPRCLTQDDLVPLRPTLCNKPRMITMIEMKGKAEVYASYGKDEMQKDPELLDALYATVTNTSRTILYEVPLVYPSECKCATGVSKMPLLVFLEDTATSDRSKLVLDEKATVVSFTKRPGHKTLNDVRMLNFCHSSPP